MTDAELNRAVAEVCGLNIRSVQPIIDNPRAHARTFVGDLFKEFDPINSWSDCGPLIALFGLEIRPDFADGVGDVWRIAWVHVNDIEPWQRCMLEEHGDDPDAALRRAVCLAVVEVAKDD